MQKIIAKKLSFGHFFCIRPDDLRYRLLFPEDIIKFIKKRRAKLGRKKHYVNPLRRAIRYQALLDEDPTLNKSKLAQKLGTSRVRVTQLLGLLKLPEDIQGRILETKGLSERSLRPLIGIQNKRALTMEFEQLLKSSLS